MNWRSGWRRLASYACRKENPGAASDVIGTPTKKSHVLGSRVECPIKGKGFNYYYGHLDNFREVGGSSGRERESKGKGYIFGFAFTTQ